MYIGQKVRIKENCKLSFLRGKEAAIAYIGTNGVSVYLLDDNFDDCIPLNLDEIEILENENVKK